MTEDEIVRNALAASEAWLRRWATHSGTCVGGYGCTCGLTLVQAEAARGLEVADFGTPDTPQ